MMSGDDTNPYDLNGEILGGGRMGGGGKSPKTPTGKRGEAHTVKKGSNEGSVINGRKYRGHSLDRMQERGFTLSVVENTIAKGIPIKGNKPNTIRFYDKDNNISVVINKKTGEVITVRGGN